MLTTEDVHHIHDSYKLSHTVLDMYTCMSLVTASWRTGAYTKLLILVLLPGGISRSSLFALVKEHARIYQDAPSTRLRLLNTNGEFQGQYLV